jgi:predicted NUDIX family NTP pyrophosphohydrolase
VKHSAGIVVLRRRSASTEIFLVHPGGPLWAKKDDHGWSIPKGEYESDDEDAMTAACREFEEEVGAPVPDGPLTPLPQFRAGRKRIAAWMVEGDVDPAAISSNHFEMEWPPKSGRMQSFPEVDRACWFDLQTARTKLHKGQAPIVDLIEEALNSAPWS